MKVLSKLFGQPSDRGFSVCRTQVKLLLAALLLLTVPLSQAVIIDSFDTQQLPVSLQSPADIGNTAGSSQAAAEAIGGIRNYNAELLGGSFGNQVRAFVGGGLYNHVQDPSVTGRSQLIYDGSADPLNVDATGLGGIDLTDGGTSNAIEVRVVFADQGGSIVIEVYTDANNRSTVTIPITVTATEEIFIVPFTDFVTAAGASGPADFSNVGALTLDVDGATTAALDVQLDLLQTRSTLRAEKAASLLVDNNGNGLVDAGDQIEYSVVVQNISATPLNNVVFNDFVDINSTLDCTAPGEPTTTQGTISVCDNGTGELSVDIGVLDVGAINAVTITFRVDVNTPIPDGVAEICNQGFFSGDSFTDLPTDDPATFDIPDDPTCLPVTSRIIIEKFTDPAGSPQVFEFTGDLNGGLFNLTDGTSFTEELAPGVYQVVETALPGWSLTNLVCDDTGDPLTVVDLATRSATINLDGGETVTCTFTNTEEGSLTIIKQTDPPGATQVFDFTGSLGPFQLQDGQSITQLLAPGVYNVAETLPAGWTLLSATCDDGSTVDNIVIGAGEDVICTFVNGQEGSITIVKNTIGNDGTFEFTSTTLTPSPFNITTSGNTGSLTFSPLPPGVYDVAETVPTGWDLIEAVCSDGSPVSAIDLNGGENVTCTFTNRQRGTLIVEKIAQGGDDTFGFTSLSVAGFDITTSGGTGSQSFPDLIPGVYDVNETTIPPGWTLVGSACDDGSPISSIDIAAGETVICTFTNQREGDITIIKNTVGADGTFQYTSAALGNFGIITAGNTGSQSFTGLAPGAYDVAEIIPAGWSLTDLVCTDPNGNSVIDAAAGTVTINLDPGESISCTFTNTQLATLIVQKITDPAGSTQSFSFTGALGNFNLLDGQSNSGELAPGVYSVAEIVPAGWQLASATCTDGSPVNAIDLAAGETVTCTFVNSVNASITIVKNTIGNDGSFEFTSSTLSPSPFTIPTSGNTGSQSFGPLPAGVYDVAETVPAGWDLISSTCDNGSPVNAINLNGGDNVTCTFTNRQRGTLIVQKIAQGGNDTFGFTSLSVAGFNITTTGGTGSQTFNDLIPGIYDVNETTVPAGWNLTGASCDDGSPISSIDIAAGETVTCTFTNQREGDITIIKNTVGANGTFQFSSLALGNFGIPTAANTGSQNFPGLTPGSYDVAEVIPTGWQLTNLVCNDPTSNTTVNVGAGTASITLDPGESVSCTYTNTQEGTIIVEKQTDPDAAPDLFSFSGDASGAISDGQQIIVNGLLPGNYSSTEAVLADWTLSGIACDDANSGGSVATRTANFVLEAGETVTCVFTNVQGGTITVEKQTIPDGSLQNFTYSGDVAGSIADNGVITVPVGPGTYTSTEIVPSGWELTGIVCDDTDSSGNVPAATATFVVDPGESVRCVFTNTQQGTIIVEKQTLPDGSPQTFGFSGDAAGTLGDGGEIIVNNLSPGVYSSTEAVPAGWDLSSIVCDDSDSTGNTVTATANFNLQAGETVRCVFTNTERGTIIVEKQTLPDGAPDSFTFSGDASGAISDGQQITVADLIPGNYSSTETVPAGWDLTSVVCDDGNSSGNAGTATASFVLDPGETVTCVFTNTQRGTIIVEKQTQPDGAPDTFTFTGAASGTISDGQQIVVNDLIPGNYSSSETVPLDWALTGIACDDTNSSGNVGTLTANFVLDPGETVTCVFTNTQGGSITVEKQTDPDGSPQTFEFTGDVAGTIGDNGSITVPVEPGTYTSTELLPTGWDLTSIVCDDTDSSGDTVTATATFQVDAGEAVRCVFTNTGRGTIIVEKQTDPDGSTQTFDFSGDATGSISDGQQIVVADLPPGVYTSTELVPAGWDLTSIVCDADGSSGDVATATATFNLDAGQTITCVFTNTQRGSIVVEKQTVPDGATDVFNFSGDAAGNISDGQQIVVDDLVPGNYSSVESALPEWALTGIVCDDANSSGDVGTATANFVLDPGETVTCVFTNTQGGSITVEKQTLPDGSPQSFTFSGDVAGSITDGNSITVPVEPGTYTSTELLPAGWDLTSIACDDTDSSGDIGTATATFEVAAGEAVRCVFTNTQRSTIVVVKETVGGDDTFDFTSSTLDPASFSLTTVTGTASTSFGDLQPGSYDVAETVPAGWTLTSQTCDNGDAPSAIALDAGETVTCTFINNIDVLEIVEVLSLCENDTPYVDYEVQNVPAGLLAAGTTDFTIRWIAIEDGSNDVVEELVNPPLSGRLLWPGAEIDGDGNPIDWPGWDFVAGVGWVQVPTNLRPTILIEFEANNVVSEVLSYPPSTPFCSPNPPPSVLVEVPTLSRNALILMIALMLAMGMVASRNMRFARHDR